jgi:hypothetical protein
MTDDRWVIVMEQLEPHAVLVGSRADEGLMEAIEAYCELACCRKTIM